MYDLTILIRVDPPRTTITVMWNSDLPHLDCTLDADDEPHHVTYSVWSISAETYGSVTVWFTDSRPWVGLPDLIFFDVPGLEFFTLTGEYDRTGVTGDADVLNYTCKHLLVKWFRQVIPAGSEIDLLRQEIRSYSSRYGTCVIEQISESRFPPRGFILTPLILLVTL